MLKPYRQNFQELRALHNANLSAKLQTLTGNLLPLWQEFLKSNLQPQDQISLHQAIKSNPRLNKTKEKLSRETYCQQKQVS